MDGTKHRVHHSYIWLQGIRVTLILIFATAISFFSSIAGVVAEYGASSEAQLAITVTVLICIASVVVIAAIVFGLQWWSYRHLYYVLTPDEFDLHSGIFNKKRVHVPYDKVQSVDQKASLLQRIAGVCTVYIDTAGGASNKAIVVPYVTKHDAEWLRSELFARKTASLQADAPAHEEASAPVRRDAGNVLDAGQQVWDELGGVFAGDAFDSGAASFEYGLTNKELILAGISNKTSFVWILFLVVLFLMQAIGFVAELVPSQGADIADGVAQGFGSYLVSAGIGMLLALAVPAIVVIWVGSVIASCINFGGFRASRRGRRIEVQHGLLQHTFQGIDIDRVQAVIVRQSFVRRLIGYCEISLAKVEANAAGDENKSRNAQSRNGVVVHPFAKLSDVPEILAGLVPEFEDVPTMQRPVAPVALRRALTRRCIVQGVGFWFALCVFAFQVIMTAACSSDPVRLYYFENYFVTIDELDVVNSICVVCYALALVFTVTSAIGAVLWSRSSSFAFNARFMQVTNGGFSIEKAIFPRQKIQFGYAKTNPLQRAAHTATVKARTAAGIGGLTFTLIDATESDACEWLAWLEPRMSDREPAAS